MTSMKRKSHSPGIFGFLSSALARLASNLRIGNISDRLSAEYKHYHDAKTEKATQTCEKLLESIKESKSIAEEALSPDVKPEDVRHALQDILVRLSKAID
jgi:hypothetical protein